MGQSDRSEASAHVHHPWFDAAKKKKKDDQRMSGSHTADHFLLFKGLAELFAADIITDDAGSRGMHPVKSTA